MIIIKSEEEVEKIRESARVLVDIMCRLKDRFVKPGVSLKDIDREVRRLCNRYKVKPAFLGYRGYPASVCLSVDDVVIHGIPKDEELKEGQIISIDLGIEKEGFFSDAARTYPVGEIGEDKRRLIEVTRKALFIGIDNAKAGNRVFDISGAIERWVTSNGYTVIREFAGHGVGIYLHEEPQIPNFVPDNGLFVNHLLRRGMVIAIEPMVNMGRSDIYIEKDGWTVRTRDGLPSAHFEDTVYIKDGEVEILTEGCYG